ncbi:hypothetical protein ES705_37291 [subsurface metagenome]
MKTNQLIIGILAIGSLYFMSCGKSDSKPSDFRDKYIGKYQVHEWISSYGFPDCGEPYSRERDTIIRVIYGETDSTLIVLGRVVWLDSSGYFSDYHYGLRLWNDSIWSYYMNGGLGCGQIEIYEGYKISDIP